MKVEVVLTELDIAQEFVEAMEARDIPEKFFYWFPRSTAEWTALAHETALYGGLAETWKEIAADASSLAEHFAATAPVISFGAGDGSRDRVLMNGLKDAGLECLYYPVDASQPMLEVACAGAEDEEFEAVAIKADISSPVHLVYAADAAEPPRLFIISGNTMGAFDPLAEIRYIAQCMKPEDRLIVDGEVYQDEKTLSYRDHPAARGFLQTLLSSVGIGKDDGELRFKHKVDERHEGLHLISRSFQAARDLAVIASGREIGLQRGERVGLNFQYTYEPKAFLAVVQNQGGLDIVKDYRSPDGRFLTLVCKK